MCRFQHLHATDPTSFVNLSSDQVIVRHIGIDWLIDFSCTKLSGHVDLLCESQQVGECGLTLDSRDLKITNVELILPEGAQSPLVYHITDSEADPTLGTPVTVELPPSSRISEQYTVRVYYETTPASSALQWLNPEQTRSRKHPFVFSQCQAIHARSLLPCQDLCAVKVTYSARITHPSHLTALMSSIRGSQQPSPDHPQHTVSSFDQPVPIPSYLIAIVCGELDGRKIGPRSTVWAEPAVVDAAASEFEDTEKMIQVAETLCGPYRFGVFDLLVLPPSFPYGGMENPCLTFVTPTLLAGDKSQVAVIAHELAHSWSGNLVTNQTWEHFWINEGLTVFTETKIVNKLFGSDAASIRAQEGWDHLKQYIDQVGAGHNYTKLCPQIKRGEDPDDSFSVVPYEKGAALFWYLESLVGKNDFESFIIDFFNHFAFKTVSSEMLQNFASLKFTKQLETVDWNHWFHSPGMPMFKPHVDLASIQEAQSLAKLWTSNDDRTVSSEESHAVSVNWPSGKKCLFINALLESTNNLSIQAINTMKKEYKFLETNCEVRCGFITLMLRASGTGIDEAIKLATEQGRMKYTRPMYKELARVDRDIATATFVKHRSMYHPICAKMVARDLGL